MKLSVSLLADGQIIPAGAEVDPSIVPDHIKKQYELSIQPKKKVPKDHQGARYCDAQGNLITDWDEHLACAREGGLENLVQVQCRSAGLPGQRPRLMITLQRLKQVLSHYLDSDEFTWKDCIVVARARGGTTTPDIAERHHGMSQTGGFTFFLQWLEM